MSLIPRVRSVLRGVRACFLLFVTVWWWRGIAAQQPNDSAPHPDSAAGAIARPPWRGGVTLWPGPSLGPPPFELDGKTPPTAWCLRTRGRSSDDRAEERWEWGRISRRMLLPKGSTAAGDTISEVTDEAVCKKASAVINRDLLGWRTGGPPVVIFRFGAQWVVYPSNASMGEFGLAVFMDGDLNIHHVSTW